MSSTSCWNLTDAMWGTVLNLESTDRAIFAFSNSHIRTGWPELWHQTKPCWERFWMLPLKPFDTRVCKVFYYNFFFWLFTVLSLRQPKCTSANDNMSAVTSAGTLRPASKRIGLHSLWITARDLLTPKTQSQFNVPSSESCYTLLTDIYFGYVS